MSKLRFRVVETAFKKKPVAVAAPAERPSEYYAKYVFNKEKMFRYLPSKVYAKLIDVIDNGAPLDRSIADEVAAGMKKWALEMGVTHYTHWFHPLTEGTAEKHDAFIEHDGKGGVMEEFTGKLLVQQEPDASSFPNGGIRNTFEARGYSAWDPSSPAFIVDDTLCIPTIFIAYTGESLDYKAPLLKALRAVDKAAVDVCRYFNPEVKKVEDLSNTDRARFEKLGEKERLEEVFKFERPYPEIKVTPEVRQAGFESFVTTDDHLMHVTGITKDQNGTKYYITKNSWGTDRNKFGGYLNMSESFVRAKTIYVMVHKDAIPKAIKIKLGIK